MEYNTQKERLILSDYGRTVQEMVACAMKIADRDERTRCAHTIVRVMATLTGLDLRNESNQQKLWDHLIEIADYNLDVDTPVTITPREQRASRPTPLPYPMRSIQSRHYGANIETALARIAELPEGKERDALTALIANQMKRTLSLRAHDNGNDERIIADLRRYTQGRVALPEHFRFANPNAKCSQGSNSLIGGKKKKKK